MSKTLQEYLIALGFKMDEAGMRRFNDTLVHTSKGVMALGSQVTATAAAVELAVIKITDQFTSLYYVGQRTDSSVAKLQGWESGARQIGLTSEKARSAVEGLARAMRSSPGVEALVNQLGIKTKGRDTTDVLHDIVGKLRQMPFYMAAQYGQLLGQNPDDLLMMMQRFERAEKATADYQKRQKAAGVDADDLARKSSDFDRKLEHLSDTFGILAQRVAMTFLPTVEKAIVLIDQLAEAFTQWDKASGGWVTWWSTIATSALGLFLARAALVRLGLIKMGEAAAATSTALGTGLLGKIITGALRIAGPVGWLLGMTEEANKGEQDIYTKGKNGQMELTDYGRSLQGGGKGQGGAPGGSRQEMGQYVMSFFQSMGWTKEQAAGLAANADRESGFKPTAVGDSGRAVGLFQWHPDRQKAYFELTGKDLRDASVDDQLRFAHHELTQGAERAAGDILRRTRTAGEAGAAVSRFYERPRNTEGEANSRATAAEGWFNAPGAPPPGPGGGVNIQQKTDIHVSGTNDPKEAGAQVLAGQGRVNGDLVRNLVGATR